MTRIRPGASPCRGTLGDRPRHVCSREHAALVEDYRLAREAWERALESAALGYPTETAEFRAEHPPPTLRTFLSRP